jgi:hypothetical protein
MVMKKRADPSLSSALPPSRRLQPVDEQVQGLYGPESSHAPSLDSADWQAIEIDGEAEPVYEVSSPSPVADLADSPERLIEDLKDEIITAGLEQRRLTVSVDETAIFRLALLNSGATYACFEVRVEGWIQEQWVKITRVNSLDDGADTAQIWLQPGERALLHIAITPPRASSSRAGAHDLAVVIRLAQPSQHMARLGAILTIKPFISLQLGAIHPQRLSTSWARRSAVLRVPVTNHGNTATEIYIQGQAAAPSGRSAGGAKAVSACHFTFYGPGSQQPHARRVRTRYIVSVPAGKTAHIITQVTPARRPLLALRNRIIPIRLAVGLANAQNAPLLIRTTLTRIPLIGPWHLLTLLSIVLFSGVGMVLVAAATAMLALGPRGGNPQGAVAAPMPISAPHPEGSSTTPPVVAVIVQLAQPAPLLAATEPLQTAGTGPVIDTVPPASSQPDPAVPVVQLDQVSAPGPEGAPPAAQTNQFLPPPTFATRQTTSATMTYQQMFQEIATRYDLNWRMLAAQAYIESSFDTVALNGSGAMGLMQVMPGTWREWSPVVDVHDPFDAYSNVMVAAVYLDHLRSRLSERGHSQMEWMLVAYNWGIDKLNEHLDAGLDWDALPAESRQYALDILRMAETIPAD